MKNIECRRVEKNVVVSVTCDVCGTCRFLEDGAPIDTLEFVHINQTCGYNNVAFGDMTKIELDLCQYCVKNLLGRYIRQTKY